MEGGSRAERYLTNSALQCLRFIGYGIVRFPNPLGLDRGRRLDRSIEERELLGGVVHIHLQRLHSFLPHRPRYSYQNLDFGGIAVELHFKIE